MALFPSLTKKKNNSEPLRAAYLCNDFGGGCKIRLVCHILQFCARPAEPKEEPVLPNSSDDRRSLRACDLTTALHRREFGQKDLGSGRA